MTCAAILDAGHAKGRLAEIFRKTGEANRAALTPALPAQTTQASTGTITGTQLQSEDTGRVTVSKRLSHEPLVLRVFLALTSKHGQR